MSIWERVSNFLQLLLVVIVIAAVPVGAVLWALGIYAVVVALK